MANPKVEGSLPFSATGLASTAESTSAGQAASSSLGPEEVVAGRYVVERQLGEGTFGWVFAALDSTGGGRVALKVLRPEYASQEAVFLRFKRRELEILRRVHAAREHQNVVRVLEPDLVSHRGLAILVLEHIDGPGLDQILARERILDPGEARRLAASLARGLEAIHAAGGVHRDLKPANVRIRGDGEPVILDLGIARAMWETQTLTGTGQHLMTPLYASPEQLAGHEVGQESDVYALGLMLYEMLTGMVPLAGRTYVETAMARTTRSAPDPRSTGRKLDPVTVECTLACLQKDPEKRPTAADVARRLEAAPKRRGNGARRRTIAITGGVVTMAAAFGVLGWRTLASDRPPAARPAPTPVAPRPEVVPTRPPREAPAAAVEAPPTPPSLGLSVEVPASVADGARLIIRAVTASPSAHVALVGLSDQGATLLVPASGRGAARSVPPGTAQARVVASLPQGSPRAVESVLGIATTDRSAFLRLLEAVRGGRLRLVAGQAPEPQVASFLASIERDRFEYVLRTYVITKRARKPR